MSPPFDAEAHADHMAKVMDLEIAPEFRASVVENLKATAAAAALVMTFRLDDHIEPGPVFEP